LRQTAAVGGYPCVFSASVTKESERGRSFLPNFILAPRQKTKKRTPTKPQSIGYGRAGPRLPHQHRCPSGPHGSANGMQRDFREQHSRARTRSVLTLFFSSIGQVRGFVAAGFTTRERLFALTDTELKAKCDVTNAAHRKKIMAAVRRGEAGSGCAARAAKRSGGADDGKISSHQGRPPPCGVWHQGVDGNGINARRRKDARGAFPTGQDTRPARAPPGLCAGGLGASGPGVAPPAPGTSARDVHMT
jgi:hypothetical protein